MAVLASKTLYLESVHMGEQSHTAKWILADIQCVIESLKCQVAGAVTDITTPNKKAWKYLSKAYPKAFFHRCVAHVLYLLIKDIFGLNKTKDKTKGKLPTHTII